MTVPAPPPWRWYCPSRAPASWSIRSRCQSRSGEVGSPQRSRREAVWVASRATSTSRQRVETISCPCIAGAKASTSSATASERNEITGFLDVVDDGVKNGGNDSPRQEKILEPVTQVIRA